MFCDEVSRAAVSSVSVSKNKQNSLWIPKRIPEPSYFHTSRYLRDEVREVKVPQLAESLSEGSWDKGKDI
ncbi:hypothetical protein CEXT_304061 [Caerostris extrusa]|uniref:Uncharacterized protein n=1 Tax=Caerostris extrusa TaxID=172846 RepID=A0AAV4MFW8_CAEEX|nr:hypothetical protein CEXT_304061 [Caerostris extrusa]